MKIFPLDELTTIIAKLKAEGKTIIQCHGCFDLLHYGHLLHLRTAKLIGDIVVVSVTADKFVNKGDGRPVFDHDQRADMLEALECVDYVTINHHDNAVPVIMAIRPDYFCKGVDYTNSPPDKEQIAVKANGGKVVFTSTEKYSSTALLGKL